MAPRETALTVVGACTHNLREVSCRVPHGQLTVVTGPSGAGKSSLVLDTIHAEAQRRFVESMSTYARQFLSVSERPPFESMDGVLPAIAIEARTSVRNARSTVGTLSETYDVLRLVFAAIGAVGCGVCGDPGPLRAVTVEEVVERLLGGEVGEKFLLLAELARPARGADARLAELVRQGLLRALVDGEVVRLETIKRWPKALARLAVVVGRFDRDTTPERLADSVETAWALAGDVLVAAAADDPTARRTFGRRLLCARCGALGREPNAALFSYHSPLGACPTCKGFGRVIGVDRRRVIPNPAAPVGSRFIAPWNSPAYEELYAPLRKALARRGVDLATPWNELGDEVRDFAWRGARDFTGIGEFFEWLERRSYKVHVRVLLARYRSYERCLACNGARLVPEALGVRVHGANIAELAGRDITTLLAWARDTPWSATELARGGLALAELRGRLAILERVGVGYLSLDRAARTLSGGEMQRLQLAGALGNGLTGTLYCFDEPTIGLHPRDAGRLLVLLRELAERGNTVLVVEHDAVLIRGADHLIDMGPGAGIHGGEVLVEGPAGEVLADPRSITGRFLAAQPGAEQARRHLAGRKRERRRASPAGSETGAPPVPGLPMVTIRGAREHTLKGFDVSFPLGALVAVTGVSGSGKSTLVESVLVEGWRARQGASDAEPGACDAIEGLEEIVGLEFVDQRPIGRSSRSNPVSYVKAWDDLRALLAATPEAVAAGLTAGSFSFNQDRGRCETCKGTGAVEVDLHFLAPVEVVCDSCNGRRFSRPVLAAKLDGLDVAELLELTVLEAHERFAARRRPLARRLGALVEVGLGYLQLGQSTNTLSAGEAQRLKLATFLLEPTGKGRRLLVFDEPTTGLHLSDIESLARTLRGLVRLGHGVLVVEHQLDLIARADWIVDLGPDGGPGGGDLVFAGPLASFLGTASGATAQALREHVGLDPLRGG